MIKFKSFILTLAFLILAGSSENVFAKKGVVISGDGVSIAYQVKGKGKIALVFVHGWCCDKRYWDDQVSYFSKHYKVVTLDLAGHGDSGLNRKEWSMPSFGHDAAAVVKKLDLRKAILLGHSMGGHVIVETARLLPERVIGLVGVDTFKNVEKKLSRERLDQFTSLMRENFAKTMGNYLRQTMFTSKTDPALVEKIVKDMASAPPEVGIGCIEGIYKQDLTAVIKEVKVPILCINSDKYPNNIEAGKRHAVSFEVKMMTGVGHFLMMEDPKIFNHLLEETVKGLVKLSL
jgi:pimeloyl-ACP methyl ester carboxylesterase